MNRPRPALLLVAIVAVGVLAFAFWPHQPSGGSSNAAVNAPSTVSGSPHPEAVPPSGIRPPSAVGQPPTTPAATPVPPYASRPGTARAPTTPAGSAPLPAAASAASSSAAVDPLAELGNARRMIVDYHTLTGENPVGTNAEITHALMGGNPREATLIRPEDQRFNEKGELIDRWGTPYFFHQLSGDLMEIHSAGPDKIMGTADDLVVK